MRDLLTPFRKHLPTKPFDEESFDTMMGTLTEAMNNNIHLWQINSVVEPKAIYGIYFSKPFPFKGSGKFFWDKTNQKWIPTIKHSKPNPIPDASKFLGVQAGLTEVKKILDGQKFPR